MTIEQGKPLRMARTEVTLRRRLPLWFAEEAKRVYGEIDPFVPCRSALPRPEAAGRRGCCHHAVELSDLDDHPEGRAGAGRGLHDRAEAGRADAAVRDRDVPHLRGGGCPARRREPRDRADPVPIGDELLTNPAVRKITFTGSTEVGGSSRARGRARHEACVARARWARTVHRVLRRRPRARGQGRGAGQVPQHRPGVHLPEPAARAPVDRGGSSSTCSSPGSASCGRATGSRTGSPSGRSSTSPRMAKMDAACRRRGGKGAITRHGRRAADRRAPGYFCAPTLLTDVTPEMRIYREETFGPIAPVTVFDDDDEVDRDGQRHVLRAGVLRLHPDVSRAIRTPKRSGSAWSASTTSTRRRPPRRSAGSRTAASAVKVPARVSTSTSTRKCAGSRCDRGHGPPRPPLGRRRGGRDPLAGGGRGGGQPHRRAQPGGRAPDRVTSSSSAI